MKKRGKNRIGFALLCALGIPPGVCRAGQAPPEHPLQSDLHGVSSRYTAPLIKTLLEWPPAWAQADRRLGARKFFLRCVSTPGDPFYMGFEQIQEIDAPLRAVAKVLDDVDSYKEIFPGFADIRMLRKDGNLWLTAWRQSVPLPFVPDVRYRMSYVVSGAPSPAARPEREIYRYQLSQTGTLTQSDGFVVLEADGAKTSYFELDFYDARWGIAKVFGQKKLWGENAEAIALSDLGIKLKAENPSMRGEDVRKAAQRLLKADSPDLACGKSVPAAALFPGLAKVSGK